MPVWDLSGRWPRCFPCIWQEAGAGAGGRGHLPTIHSTPAHSGRSAAGAAAGAGAGAIYLSSSVTVGRHENKGTCLHTGHSCKLLLKALGSRNNTIYPRKEAMCLIRDCFQSYACAFCILSSKMIGAASCIVVLWPGLPGLTG